MTALELHFHPIVLPALPANTTKYLLLGSRLIGEDSVRNELSSPHAPRPWPVTTEPSAEPGALPLADQTDTEYVPLTADELASFALRSRRPTSVTRSPFVPVEKDCASQLAPWVVRQAPSMEMLSNGVDANAWAVPPLHASAGPATSKPTNSAVATRRNVGPKALTYE